MEAKDKSEAGRLWQSALAAIRQSQTHSRQLLAAVQSRSQAPLGLGETPLSYNGTETLHAGGAPLVPEINPVVILQGSDFEMG
jgi:hypothetical protein